MITFTPFRTPRLTVQLRELTIGNSIELCSLPASRHEAAMTMALTHIIEPSARTIIGQVEDPRLWTVQERGAVFAHYLAHTLGADFAVGDKAKFSDYLFQSAQTASEILLGPVADDEWIASPLLGYQAESIERLINNGRIIGKRVGWMMAAMACQLRRSVEPPLEDVADAVFDQWLVDRLSVFVAFPQSDFADLLDAFLMANHQMQHLLRAAFNDEGVVYVTEVPDLPPARFPVSDLLDERAAQFIGVAQQSSGGTDQVRGSAV